MSPKLLRQSGHVFLGDQRQFSRYHSWLNNFGPEHPEGYQREVDDVLRKHGRWYLYVYRGSPWITKVNATMERPKGIHCLPTKEPAVSKSKTDCVIVTANSPSKDSTRLRRLAQKPLTLPPATGGYRIEDVPFRSIRWTMTILSYSPQPVCRREDGR